MNLAPPSTSEKSKKTRRLSEELLELSQDSKEEDVNLQEVLHRFEGRVYTLFLVLLSLPFCQPVGFPGMSTPFGLVIALLGLRFALRQKPWLPAFALKTRIPSKFLPAVLKLGARALSWLEKLLHPRLTWVFDLAPTQFLCGMVIFICGALLLLPLPVPFSNLLPALTVILIAASVAERDGVMLGAGIVCFLLTLFFFGAIFWGGTEVVQWIETHFRGIFEPKESPPQLPHLLPGL
jgi:hypothetical protein